MDEKVIEEARLIADSLTNVKHQMIVVYTIRDLCNRLEKAQRPWVGLTDEERDSFWTADEMTGEEWRELFDAIEAKLKEKNT